MIKVRKFTLSMKFLEPYKTQEVPWGGHGLGYVVYKRTYARRLDDNNPEAGTEEWWQTCRRVIEGMFMMQKRHCVEIGVPWNDTKAQATAKVAYDRLFTLKWTPPGRGLWMMGTDFVENKTAAGLFNCAFRSTKDLATKGGYLFQWMMDALMVGIGVGFDTLGAGTMVIQSPGSMHPTPEPVDGRVNEYVQLDGCWYCIVDDSREGWVESVRILLNAYYFGYELPEFDYSRVRLEGAPIRGFGGTASGPGPLQDLHAQLVLLYEAAVDKLINSEMIVDTQNLIGRCVVAGNVRRSAALAMGQADDNRFLLLKDPTQIHEWEAELATLAEQFPIPDVIQPEELAELIGTDLKLVWDGPPITDEMLAAYNRQEELKDLIANHPLRHHRWGSNNSVNVSGVQDYTPYAELTVRNGEPGYIWLENARHFGRMKDPAREDDLLVMGFNPCVTGDTWVPTDRGYKQVTDLVNAQDLSLQVNGKYYNALSNGFWQTGVKPVLKLSTREGYELKLTADHKVLTTNRSWVEAKDLRYGDRIVLNNHRAVQMESVVDHKHAEGFLLGLLVGDGTFAAGEAVLSFWDPQLALAACTAYEQAFGAREPGLSFIEDRNEWRLRRNAITQIAAEYGITQGSKRNIDKLMSSSDSVLRGFLRGLFDADGTVIGSQQKGVSVRLCQNDLQMLKSVQRMLLRLGITSTIYQNRREAGKYELPDGQSGYKLYSCKAVHELVVSNEDLVHFNSQVGFASTAKQERLSTALANYKRAPNKTKFYAHFEDLEYLGEEAVYDVTVEDVHAFDANGLYVHNCVEQQLEDAELCCLVETYPWLHESYEDYLVTLKIAYLYAKTVTLAKTQWAETNAIMLKNRRIGLSMSGFIQAAYQKGFQTMFSWCDNAYEYVRALDSTYSDWLCVPRSKRTTSIKPSGTVSKLNGSNPGIHHPEAEFYIQRIRFAEDSDMLPALRAAGYHVEPCVYSPRTQVVSFPVHEQEFVRGKKQVSMWEQLEIAASMQYYWADNSVSVTVTFQDHEAASIPHALALYSKRLKAVSFLRYKETGYAQAPYEPVDEDTYNQMLAACTPVQRINTGERAAGERFCSNDSCEIDFGDENGIL